MSVRDLWTEVLARMAAALPEPTAPFLPGNGEADVARLERRVGRELPADFREFLTLHGGQDDPDWLNGPLEFQHFMTVDEMIEDYGMLSEVAADFAEPQPQPAHFAMRGWSPGWLKFASFQNDGYAIDLSPGELGTYGQVFFRPNVPDLEPPVAPSFTAFLEALRDKLAAGEYEVCDNTLEFEGW